MRIRGIQVPAAERFTPYLSAIRVKILAALDIPVRLGLANAVEADKNVRAPVVFLHGRREP